jgi:hypothetical protein
MKTLLLAIAAACAAFAQTVCQPTPAYALCEIVFELTAAEREAHPDPWSSIEIRAEVRSPRFRTFQAWAFPDGGNRMVLRFAPTEAGQWDLRLNSNLSRFQGKTVQVEATASDHPGYVVVANVRHWAYAEIRKPHLWMGDTIYHFASMDRAAFASLVTARAAQKFNHVRGYLLGTDPAKVFPTAGPPDTAFFQELDQRMRFLNDKGITVDAIIGHDENHLAKQFPERRQRERLIRYLASRYAAYSITWQLVQEFEEYERPRELLKELGEHLKKYDFARHPRTTHTTATSSPLANDGWMDYLLYQSSDDDLCAVERQIYTKPFVNAEFGYENSGAGSSHPHHVPSDEFRRRLWRSAMNGQYPTFGNTGTYGGKRVPFDLKHAESPGAKYMTNWYDFFAKTRWWDLEPYFDVDGGKAMALDGIEYILYVEKPSGPVEVIVEKHGYDVYWFNPATGEYLKQKEWKGEKFVGEPPTKTQDWVLHLSRDGKKEGMLKSYKFEARPVPVQEPELLDKAIPFELAEPKGESISASKPVKYAFTLRRQSRATRRMQYLITAEVSTNGQSFRVVGTGAQGELKMPAWLQKQVPGVLVLHISAINANGKAYAMDRVFNLVP